MIEEIKKALESYKGEWKEKNDIFEFSLTIAERKFFLAKRKLTYKALIKIEENSKTLIFSEMLKELGSGFSSGVGGFGDEMSTGFGFKAETYNTTSGARVGTIEESSSLFGKKYEYKFDYKEIRTKVENTAKEGVYNFIYKIFIF
ncbi:MAG: hypothetical protein WCV55_00380 [Candidatus Paceibacterota bacterium]